MKRTVYYLVALVLLVLALLIVFWPEPAADSGSREASPREGAVAGDPAEAPRRGIPIAHST